MVDWFLVRLDLARTPECPEGSARHGYLLRVPLDDEGVIDEPAVAERPDRTSVCRYAPDEPDEVGYVLRTGRGWSFSYALGEADDEPVFHLESHPLRVGNYVTVTEPDGQRLPFKVAEVRLDNATAPLDQYQ